MRARAPPFPLCVLNIKFAARVSVEGKKRDSLIFIQRQADQSAAVNGIRAAFSEKEEKKGRAKKKRKIRHDLASRGRFLSFTKAERYARERLFFHRLRNDESETGVSLSGCSSALSKLF